MNHRFFVVITVILSTLLPNAVIGKQNNIILIGNPRGLTTAFERYMIKRGDYKIYHEPVSSKALMANFGLGFCSALIGSNLLLSIHQTKREQPYFIKDMAFFLKDDEDLDTLMRSDEVQVIFLIRRPEQAIISHYKLVGRPVETMKYSMMEEIFNKMIKINKSPILIDADDLRTQPKEILSKLCAQLDIPFNAEDLNWESDEKLHWSFSADTWHTEVTNSTGFNQQAKHYSLDDINPGDRAEIEALIRDNQKIYNSLIKYKIEL